MYFRENLEYHNGFSLSKIGVYCVIGYISLKTFQANSILFFNI